MEPSSGESGGTSTVTHPRRRWKVLALVIVVVVAMGAFAVVQ